MKPCGFRECRRGYTRADLAVVVLLAALVLGMVLIVATRQREGSRRLQCERNFAQTTESIIRYDELRGQLPGWRIDLDGQTRSWVVPLLPYFDLPLSQEEKSTGRRTERSGPWKKVFDQIAQPTDKSEKPLPAVGLLVCPTIPPTNRPLAPLSIAANGGMPDVAPAQGFSPDWPANGVFQDGSYFEGAPPWKLADIAQLDGTETTILLAENVDAGPWTVAEESRLTVLWFPEGLPETVSPLLSLNENPGGGDGSIRFARPASLHKMGWTTSYCDGSVKWTHGQIDPVAWAQLMSVDGTKTRLPGQETFLPAPYRREPIANSQSETASEESDEPLPPEHP